MTGAQLCIFPQEIFRDIANLSRYLGYSWPTLRDADICVINCALKINGVIDVQTNKGKCTIALEHEAHCRGDNSLYTAYLGMVFKKRCHC